MDITDNICDLCRLCAIKTAVFNRLHIFDNEGKFRDLNSKITSCLAISITESDYLPKVLCMECVNQLESYHAFKANSLKTELFFKDVLSRQSQPMYGIEDCELTTSNLLKPVFNDEPSDQISFPLCQSHATEAQYETIKQANLSVGTGQAEDIVCEPSLYIKEESASFTQGRKHAGIKNTGMSLTGNNVSKAVQNKPVPAAPRTSLFRCHYCKVLFPTRRASLEHLTLMHKKIHKCDVCAESFRSAEALAVHKERYLQQLKDREVKMDCKRQKFKDKGSKRESKKCRMCGKEYARNRELNLHERSHTGEKPFNCTYCDKTFASTSARNKHIQVHEKRWSHVCSFCGKGFVDKIHFIYHVQKHHTGERPFPCTQCEKKFVRKQDLHMHELNMHSTKPKVCYKCETCNKTYTTMSYLRQHKKIHELPLESRKTFKCNICDAVFLRNNNLKQHTLIHTGELPYECDLCKKRFSSKIGLKIHLLIHSGVKKFVCEVCGKAFALRNSLVCHRRTHTGERPYQCDICHQQFTQKSSLNTHRKRHARDEVPLNWHN